MLHREIFPRQERHCPISNDMLAEGRALMDAVPAVQAENFGDATEHLNKALQGGLVQESWNFTDNLERLLRLSIAAEFGERLVDWFEEARLAGRYAPIHAALKAAVHGEATLLDVNPEPMSCCPPQRLMTFGETTGTSERLPLPAGVIRGRQFRSAVRPSRQSWQGNRRRHPAATDRYIRPACGPGRSIPVRR